MKSLKTILPLSALSICIWLTSCNSGNTESGEHTEVTAAEQPESDQPGEAADPEAQVAFDISSIPVSDHELGTFPFFGFPEGMTHQNRPIQRKFDRLFFAIDGTMIPLEGQVWKSNIVTERGSTDAWSLPYFEKSYDEAIKAVGGVKIYDGGISREEYDRYSDQAAYLGEDGSIGYTGQTIKVYAIRRADGGDVYIQLTGNTASGKLNILQTEPFKQTITMLNADQIQRELDANGKAVLYINFDVDKATLKAEGRTAVQEIVKTLNNDPTLSLSVEGHTDNTGNADHNKKLSQDRADTVLEELTASGIDRSRLKAVGHGAEKPLVANDSEAGKAQNRRVELVRTDS